MLAKFIGVFIFLVIASDCVSGLVIFKSKENLENDTTLGKQNHSHETVFDNSYLKGSKCECVNYACGCCVYMKVPKLHLNDTGCVNLTYLQKDYGMSLTVTIDRWVLFNETVSARNPPPLCFGEEYLPIGGEICLKFYNLDASKTKLHGCAEIYAKLKGFVLAKYDLGCFDLGHKKLIRNSTRSPLTMKRVYVPELFLL